MAPVGRCSAHRCAAATGAIRAPSAPSHTHVRRQLAALVDHLHFVVSDMEAVIADMNNVIRLIDKVTAAMEVPSSSRHFAVTPLGTSYSSSSSITPSTPWVRRPSPSITHKKLQMISADVDTDIPKNKTHHTAREPQTTTDTSSYVENQHHDIITSQEVVAEASHTASTICPDHQHHQQHHLSFDQPPSSGSTSGFYSGCGTTDTATTTSGSSSSSSRPQSTTASCESLTRLCGKTLLQSYCGLYELHMDQMLELEYDDELDHYCIDDDDTLKLKDHCGSKTFMSREVYESLKQTTV